MPAEDKSQPLIGTIRPRVLRWSREPGTRVQVVGIWAFTAVLCAISKGPYSGRVFEIASAACLAFFLFPFIDGPLRLHGKGMLPLRVEYRVVEGPPDSSIPSYRTAHLLGMGFQFAGELVKPADPRNIAVRTAIFRHEEHKDTAHVAQIIGGLRTIPIMGFRTDFQDGFAFETNDARGARLFPSDPECAIFRFPNVRSTQDLYRLHCKIKERYLDAHHPALGDKDRELARVIARAEIAHQRLAKFGDYHLAPFGEFYRLTWRGAIRQSWLNAWPVKQFRALRAESRSLKMAEGMGMPINPKLGCLQDSLPRRETNALPGARRRT